MGINMMPIGTTPIGRARDERATFNSYDEFLGWLKDKPKEWFQAIATRSALRVLPLAFPDKVHAYDSFRYSFLALTFARHTDRISIEQLTKVTARAKDIDSDVCLASLGAFVSYIDTDYLGCAAGAINSALTSASLANAATEYKAALRDDFHSLVVLGNREPAESARRLHLRPLWPNGAPQGLIGVWKELVHSHDTANEHYAPWIEWYEALLPIDPTAKPTNIFGEALTIRIATQPNKWWDRPPAEVNADIARWLEEERGRNPSTSAPPSGDPRSVAVISSAIDAVRKAEPAPLPIYQWDGRQIEGRDPAAEPADSAVAETALREARRLCRKALTGLAGRNVDTRPEQDAVNELLEVLPESPDSVDPFLLASRTDGVKDLVERHEKNRGESCLDLHDLHNLAQAARVGRQLAALFPVATDMEIRATALDIAGTSIEQVIASAQTVEAAAIRTGALAPSAERLLRETTITAPDSPLTEAKTRMVARDVLNKRNLSLALLGINGHSEEEVAADIAAFKEEVRKERRSRWVKRGATASDYVIGFALAASTAVEILNRAAKGFGELRNLTRLIADDPPDDKSS